MMREQVGRLEGVISELEQKVQEGEIAKPVADEIVLRLIRVSDRLSRIEQRLGRSHATAGAA